MKSPSFENHFRKKTIDRQISLKKAKNADGCQIVSGAQSALFAYLHSI